MKLKFILLLLLSTTIFAQSRWLVDNTKFAKTDSNKIKNPITLSYFSNNTGTYLRLDQTIPQSIINGSPITEGIQFDITPTTSNTAEGLLRWNNTDGTLDLGMSGGNVTQQIGQELFIKVVNKTGDTIYNGNVVYFDGRQGNRPKIKLAQSDSINTSCSVGVTTQNILNDAEGYITTFGYVRGIKTNYTGSGAWGTTWNEGDKLYVSKTVAGQLTNIEPSVPHHSDCIGSVGIIHSNLGSIFVGINNHSTLAELSDVNGTPLNTTGQIPVWDDTNKFFDFNNNITNYLLKSDSTLYATQNDLTVGLGLKMNVANPNYTGNMTLSTQRFLTQINPTDTYGGNLFLGRDAGNLTLARSSAVTEASNNVGVGDSTLISLTTGYNNVGIGKKVLKSATSSSWRTGVGDRALENATSGQDDVGIGACTLMDLTTGQNNTSLGTTAGRFLLTGQGNFFGGWWAGRGNVDDGDADPYDISNESSYIDDYMTLLGALATRHSSIPYANKLTNGIAIGYMSKVSTSNTMALGGLGANAVDLTLGYHTAVSGTFTMKNKYLLVTNEAIPAATDSSTAVKWDGVYFRATDGDAGNISYNTDDKMLFQSSAYYWFDNNVDVGVPSVADKKIRWLTASNFRYEAFPVNDDFFIKDGQDTTFVSMYYNGGGANKYLSLRNGAMKLKQNAIGFYGTSPITKPSGDVGTALTNLGLITSPTFNIGSGTGTSLTLGATGSQFTTDITTNKWTLKNDAGSPNNLITADSTGNVIIRGDLSYDLRHVFLYGSNLTYTPDVTVNVPFKLIPGLTVQESVNITVAGDSLTITKAGDYFINALYTLQGGNGEDYEVSIYENGVKKISNIVTTTGATNYQSIAVQWYCDSCEVGHTIAFYVTNLTNSNDPTFKRAFIYVKKEHD